MTKQHNLIKTVAQIISITLIFLFSIVFLGAYWPDVQAWMDRVFDRSDQQKTGVILLGIGSVSFVILFLTGSLKR